MSSVYTPEQYVLEIDKVLELERDEVLGIDEAQMIMWFIDKCSLSDFERLKGIYYDIINSDEV